jgi:hypothetical protein
LGFGRCTLTLYAIGWADRGKFLICPTTQQGAAEIFGDRGSVEIQTELPIDGIHLMATDGIPRSKSVVNFSKAKYSWFPCKQLPLPRCLGEKNWKDARLVSPRERESESETESETESESEGAREYLGPRTFQKSACSCVIENTNTSDLHKFWRSVCALGTTETWRFALRWT